MADYQATGPNGENFVITAPDNASAEDLKAYAQKNIGSMPESGVPSIPDRSNEPMSWPERVGAGMADPVYGARQMYEHGVGSKESAAAFDKTIADREKGMTDRGMTPDDFARASGRVVPALGVGAALAPLTGGSSLLGAAAGGSVAEMLNPVTSGDYAEEKGKQALMGAAFGGGGGLLMRGAGALVGPTVREAAAELMKRGIELTPGQIMGGIARRAEEAAKSFPILGTFIRGAENRSVESFNKSAIDQALEPIAEKLPSTAKAGHEAITYAKYRLDSAYDNLLPQLQLGMDQRLASDISNARFLSSELPKAQADQFQTILENRVGKHFTDTGAVSGDRLKSIESELNKIGSQYRSSSDAAQRNLGSLIDDVRFSIRDALERQNPDKAAELAKINQSYAMFTRLESAASRRANSEGVFTPNDLLQSIKSADKTVRKGAFARGDALMQDFAEYAGSVLPSKLGDSGTTERALFALGAGGAGISGHPLTAAGIAAAVTPYTKVGQSIVNKIAQPGDTRAAVGRAIRSTTTPLGTGMEPELSALMGDSNSLDSLTNAR